MVKLTGPMFSLTASGAIADTIVYSTWKGRAYARQLVIPTNPRSAGQTGMRSMFSFLSKQWSGIAGVDQATFDADAEAKSISPFNSYMKLNMDRWKNYLPPSQTFVPAEASTPLTVTTMTLAGGEAYVNIELTPSAATDIWGFEIYREDAAITDPNNSNCIAVIPADGVNLVEYNDTGLDAGTYHYRAAVINDDGVRGTVIADDTAVAT